MDVRASQMTKYGFWRADRFPGSAIAVLLLKTSKSTVIQSLDRGAYEIGLRISKRFPSACIHAIQIAGQGIAAFWWLSVKFMCEDTIHLLVWRSANVLDKNAPVFGRQRDVGAADHGDSLVDLCQGVASRAQVDRTGADMANGWHGGRETVGRST